MMKSTFGRLWPVFLVAFVVLGTLLSGALLEVFKPNNFLPQWFASFIADWALVLSAATIGVVLVAAAISIREGRRHRSLRDIRSWAQRAIGILSISSREGSALHDLDVKKQLADIGAMAFTILSETIKVSIESTGKITTAIKNMEDFQDALEHRQEQVDLETARKQLIVDFEEVVRSISEPD